MWSGHLLSIMWDLSPNILTLGHPPPPPTHTQFLLYSQAKMSTWPLHSNSKQVGR